MQAPPALLWLAGGLATVFVLSIPRETRAWSRFMLRAWVLPSGLYWLASMFVAPGPAVLAGLTAFIGALIWAGFMLPDRFRLSSTADWKASCFFLPAMAFGMVSLVTPFLQFTVNQELPPDRPSFDPLQPLQCDGVALGDLRGDVEARLGEGRSAQLSRPLQRAWTEATCTYPSGTVVAYDHKARVVAVLGQRLEQNGRLLVEPGFVAERAKRAVPPAEGRGLNVEKGRVKSCWLVENVALIDTPAQELSIAGVRLEMTRYEAERQLGPQMTAPKQWDQYQLCAYGRPLIWVVYQEDCVAGIAGPKIVDSASRQYPSSRRWDTGVAHAYDCSHLSKPFTGVVLTYPAMHRFRRADNESVAEELESRARKARY